MRRDGERRAFEGPAMLYSKHPSMRICLIERLKKTHDYDKVNNFRV